MSIDFQCSGCSKTLRVPDEHLGKQARCPQCQTVNVIQPGGQPAVPPTKPQPSSIGVDKPAGPRSSYPTGTTLGPNPYSPNQHGSHLLPHRGGLILTLGILAIVCNIALIPGILAWIFGKGDLAQIKRGEMDREGEGLTTAGMYMGMIMTILAGVSFVLVIAFYALMALIFIAGAAGA